jgi:hypothetical protein
MFDLVFDGLELQEQRRAMNMAMQTQDQAAMLGARNAAKPQGEIATPQPRGLSPEEAAPDAGAPDGP